MVLDRWSLFFFLFLFFFVCSSRIGDHSNVWMLEKETMGESLWLCMYVTTWAAIRYSTIALIHVDIKSSGTQRHFDYGLLLDPWRTDVHHVCFQYFEYTSHKELRHNIGKQLCLHAVSLPRASEDWALYAEGQRQQFDSATRMGVHRSKCPLRISRVTYVTHVLRVGNETLHSFTQWEHPQVWRMSEAHIESH